MENRLAMAAGELQQMESKHGNSCDGFLKLATDSQLLSRLYASHGIRVRMVRRYKPNKIPTVRELIHQLSKKHDKLLEDEVRQSKPIVNDNSASSPSVPFSTGDILYTNDSSRTLPNEDFKNNLIEIDRDARENRENFTDRLRTKDSEPIKPERRSSGRTGSSKKSVSIETVAYERGDIEDLRHSPTLPPAKQNHFRSNGLSRGLVSKTDTILNTRVCNGYSGRDTDELIAMGTNWNPNIQQKGMSKSLSNSMNTYSSSSSTSITPQRKYNSFSNSKPLVLGANSQNAGFRLPKDDPRYSDPFINGGASFQQRLSELSMLEADTVRYERNRKLKKKAKQDRDS